MMRRVMGGVVLLPLVALVATAADGRNELTAKERDELSTKIADLNNRGVKAYREGKSAEAVERLEAAVALMRRLYPKTTHPDGHADLVSGFGNLGRVLDSLGKTDKALSVYAEALAMAERLYPPKAHPDGHADVAACLHDMGAVLWSSGKPDKALPYFEKTAAMYDRLYPVAKYPDGHRHLARSVNDLAGLLVSMGRPEEARPHFERALIISERLYPWWKHLGGHPELATSINNLAYVWDSLGRPDKALPLYERSLAMTGRMYPKLAYPNGHPDLVMSLNNVGSALSGLGRADEALTYHEKALALCERLYPEKTHPAGHPDFAICLSHAGAVLMQSLGQPDKALPYLERALAMREKLSAKRVRPELALSLGEMGRVMSALGRPAEGLAFHRKALAISQRLYPEKAYLVGHPDVAQGLGEVGRALEKVGKADEARSYHEQSLAMYERLYPEKSRPAGHPDLARAHAVLALLLGNGGKPAEALPHYEKALEMYVRLTPGVPHPDVAIGLNNLGFAHERLGDPDKARHYFRKSLDMYAVLARNDSRTAPIEQAARQLGSKPRTRDAFLSACLAAKSDDADSYRPVWDERVPVFRLMQRRGEAAAVARSASDEGRAAWARLAEVRRAAGLLASAPPKNLAARDRELAALRREEEALERTLAGRLPSLKEHDELAAFGPDDLAAILPEKSAFVDVVGYYAHEKGVFTSGRYLAFVVGPKTKPVRVPIDGDAKPLQQAVASWRRAIDKGENSPAAILLRDKLWTPIAKALPKDTDTVYLCLDGDLVRLPFAALPGDAPGSVLLEKYAFATVPSGQWLLQRIRQKPDAAKPSAFVLGGVDFGESPTGYKPLPATEREMKHVADLLGAKSTLSGKAATVSAVRKGLESANVAHLATHAYFDAKSLKADAERQKKLRTTEIDRVAAGREGGGLVVGRQNPLGFVGVALAGVNDRTTADGGGVLTGLDILDLPLDKLRLCVLSACETGLGEWNEYDGVAGLHRSLHVAGCRNVVSSLWGVNDDATAALMGQFYHEMLVNKRTPLQALREAQLTIRRHPERIPALSGRRGAPDFADTVKVGSAPPAKGKAKVADVRLWAAFGLSGPGN